MTMIGCEDRIKGSGETSDAQLVQSIIEANKTAISMEELPPQSISVLDQDYKDFIPNIFKCSPPTDKYSIS